VFGEHAYRIPVSSTKSQLGHLMCATGGVELVLTILAMQDGIVPPTINLDNPDPDCDLDYVPHRPRPAQVNVALSNSFGFGGQNGSLVVAKWDEGSPNGTSNGTSNGAKNGASNGAAAGVT
jgi:3-oxoacyl-[acyl-carrier-protein] synthase II